MYQFALFYSNKFYGIKQKYTREELANMDDSEYLAYCITTPIKLKLTGSITSTFTPKNLKPDYCIFNLDEREDAILYIASDGDINIVNFSEKQDVELLIKNNIIQFIDWIENKECSKMMLCDYSYNSIEEYLKSLLA